MENVTHVNKWESHKEQERRFAQECHDAGLIRALDSYQSGLLKEFVSHEMSVRRMDRIRHIRKKVRCRYLSTLIPGFSAGAHKKGAGSVVRADVRSKALRLLGKLDSSMGKAVGACPGVNRTFGEELESQRKLCFLQSIGAAPAVKIGGQYHAITQFAKDFVRAYLRDMSKTGIPESVSRDLLVGESAIVSDDSLRWLMRLREDWKKESVRRRKVRLNALPVNG